MVIHLCLKALMVDFLRTGLPGGGVISATNLAASGLSQCTLWNVAFSNKLTENFCTNWIK